MFVILKITLLLCLLTFNSVKLVAQDFITDWDLSKTGTGNNQVQFLFEGTGYINYTWEEVPSGASGFGTMIGSGNTNYDTCTIIGLPYASIIRLKIQPTNFNHFIASFDNKKLINVEQWGSVFWKSMRESFSGCSNMIISATDTPDLSTVFDMSYMFYNAVMFNQPIDSWNVTNVTNMSYMFKNASSFNQPLANWNIGNVTNMESMFLQASSFNQDISDWNTSKVTDMSSMFDQAIAFNQPIGNWDVSKVIDMSRMFFQAYIFNQPIGNWNTSQVRNMSRMFFNADSFNQPIANWNTSQVTNLSYMFYNASSFDQPIGNWNIYQVANLSYMFYNATSFNQSIGNWNTFQATDISYMFYNACSFNQPIGNWNTSNVSQMHSTFKKAISFNQPLNNWIVSNVQNMISMFDSTILFNQPLNLWDVQNVSNMSNMFRNSGFNQTLGDWNITNTTFIGLSSKMDCEKYSITLAKWYASGFTNKRLTSPGLTYGQDISDIRVYLIYSWNWTIAGDSLVDNNCLPYLVSGILYFDENGNGTYDSLDYLIPNQTVSANNGLNTYYGLTDSVGRYHISISDYSGLYTISINNNSQFSITEPLAQTYNLYTDSSYINKNFGLYSANQFSDIQSDIWAGPARFGFSNNYVVVQVCNQGTQSLSDSVSLILPLGFMAISSSHAYSQNGQMIHWNYSLNPFECKTFEFIYQIPTTIPVGSEHTFYVLTNPNSDCCSINNIDSTKVNVTAAHDPNDKQTDQGNTLSFLTNNYLDYTIRFQNVGTDTAFKVVVDDQLNYQFDIQSFQMLASSHPYKTELSNNQIKWTFENIKLPPAALNDPESNGYVRFRIKLLDGLIPPIWVDNTAFIYFDFNPAIITNTVVNQFIIVEQEIHQKNKYIHLYPNPFDQKIFFDLKQHSNADLILYNSNGQEVLSKQIDKSGFLLLDLPKGLYFYKIVVNGQIQQGKIIKSN